MAFYWLVYIGNKLDKRIFEKIFKQTMTIYLLHIQIVVLSTLLLYKYIRVECLVVVNFIAGFFLAFILANHLTKFKTIRILLGEK